MIRELPGSEGRYIGVEVAGRVTLDEEEAWIRRMDEAMERFGSISALVVMGEGVRWEAKAALKDLKWLLGHQIEIDRVAVVSDKQRWKFFTDLDSLFGKLVGIREKHFTPDRLDEAWAWVRGE